MLGRAIVTKIYSNILVSHVRIEFASQFSQETRAFSVTILGLSFAIRIAVAQKVEVEGGGWDRSVLVVEVNNASRGSC